MDDLPAVSFVVITDKDPDSLTGCLETISCQEYPERLVEIVVVMPEGCGEVADVAVRFNAVVVRCGEDDAVARVNLGLGKATGEIVFAIGADGGLSRTDWIRLMVRPFTERPDVAGVFTQIAEVPTDGPFARYLCRTNGDPFGWFVYGDTANPRYCLGAYGVAGSGEGYEIHRFPVRRPPLIPPDHGVGVRRSAVEAAGMGDDKAPPLVRLIEARHLVALVQGAGIHHKAAESLPVFVREYRAWLRGSHDGWPVCGKQHPAHNSPWRRIRRVLFEIYGLTAVMPLLDGVWLSVFERSSFMLWHGPVSISLSWLILFEKVGRWTGHQRTPEPGLDEDRR
ncbi:MAG: glycosyltransferase family 2 protein [bacterium]